MSCEKPCVLDRGRVLGKRRTRGNVCSGTAPGKKLVLHMLSESRGAVRLALHVQPGAKRNAIVGVHGDALKVAISAPPVDGKANEAIRTFVAEALGVSASAVSVVAGASSRRKVLAIADVSLADIQMRVNALLQP